MPAHHNLEAYLAAYIETAGIGEQQESPLPQSRRGHGQLTDKR